MLKYNVLIIITKGDELMTWSDGASIASIIIAVFAMWQTYESSKRAEMINEQTLKALTEIKICTATIQNSTNLIQNSINSQQSKQIDVIISSSNKMVDALADIAKNGGKFNE